jgi:hypothetical protein
MTTSGGSVEANGDLVRPVGDIQSVTHPSEGLYYVTFLSPQSAMVVTPWPQGQNPDITYLAVVVYAVDGVTFGVKTGLSNGVLADLGFQFIAVGN